ncbi:hypothetical protein [Sphingomonas oleivorans]|uniref:hypothetical protein n=1 Tax=Sphingomonas oleivorans TaxID=1735121 RepID=UPI00105707E7|nr:hypothetical protein [Sphingomonas oleivorans]
MMIVCGSSWQDGVDVEMSGRAFISAVFAIVLILPSEAVVEAPVVVDRNGNIAFKVQTFDVPPTTFDPHLLSVAEVYREAAKWGGTIPALNVSILCEISDDGTVDRNTCEADSWSSKEQLLAMRLVRAAPQSALPQFPAINRTALGLAPRGTSPLWSKLVAYRADVPGNSNPPFFRLARVAVRIDRTQPPAVDLTTGPLVELAQISFEAGKDPQMNQYPSRALRENREGTQTAECQVQADRSVICRDESFDPPESALYFAGSADSMFRRVVVQERLKNGANAAGSRFRYKLRWKLPN